MLIFIMIVVILGLILSFYSIFSSLIVYEEASKGLGVTAIIYSIMMFILNIIAIVFVGILLGQ